jgi:hypothetical protein
MQSLTPGVTVTSVDEAEGTALITIPDATKNVQLSYSPVDATGQVGATVFMAGFGTREMHMLHGCALLPAFLLG